LVPGIISSGSSDPTGSSTPATPSLAQKTPRKSRFASIGFSVGLGPIT
jgi:hypothetical protein